MRNRHSLQHSLRGWESTPWGGSRNVALLGRIKDRQKREAKETDATRLQLFEKICARHQTKPRFYFLPSSTTECRSPFAFLRLRLRLRVPSFLPSLSPGENREVAHSFRGPSLRPFPRPSLLAASLTAAAADDDAAPPPRSSCVLYIRHFLHSLHLSLSPSLSPSWEAGGH